jgi:hypothetical protein
MADMEPHIHALVAALISAREKVSAVPTRAIG